jgi:hypothetical protein
MTTYVSKFKKKPTETKRYDIEWRDWLDVGETVQGVTYEVSLPMTVSNSSIVSGTRASFFVAGGNHNETYDVVVTMTTTNGQVRTDTLQFAVRN